MGEPYGSPTLEATARYPRGEWRLLRTTPLRPEAGFAGREANQRPPGATLKEGADGGTLRFPHP